MKCEQCGKEIPITNKHNVIVEGKSMTLCGKHYSQWVKYKKFLDKDPKSCFDANEYEITNEGTWIFCFNRQNEPSGKFLIDTEDLERVIAKKWRFWKGQYFTGNFKPITIYRFLMNPKENEVIDHINGNVWDNRKSNLRLTTQQNNLINKAIQNNNTSGIAGVSWDKTRGKWAVEIRFNGQRVHLSRWDNFEDAVYVRYIAELKLFKEFRSTRNDKKILEYVNKCNDKEKLQKYTYEKLNQYFS